MTYDYKCAKCGYIYEHQKLMNDPHPTQCPNCKAENALTQQYTARGALYNCTGFPDRDAKGYNWK